MNQIFKHQRTRQGNRNGWWLLLAAFAVTLAVYWPGLSGGFLFDDYPNIVDNHGVQPPNASLSSLIGAALSSPSSEFKRPLASLSFAANYLVSGIDPFWMKLTNLVIHLLNGLLVFLLARALLLIAGPPRDSLMVSKRRPGPVGATSVATPLQQDDTNTLCNPLDSIAAEAAPTKATKTAGVIAALIAASWMLLPINLTGVLYVVQRMESMANLFVLLGLLGYVAGRRRMLAATLGSDGGNTDSIRSRMSSESRDFLLCLASIVGCTGLGVLAKETAVMLPMYAVLIEWLVFGFRKPTSDRDHRVIGLFVIVLLLPMIAGLAWLLPQVFNPGYWSTRDFDLRTRLLSEARIVADYIRWTLLPTPDALSFYHDDFRISTGLLVPWTTLASVALLGALVALMLWIRKRLPLAALGIGLFLGCQLLTGTILPLELIYEHRNYFASFGLLLAIISLLAAPSASSVGAASAAPASPPTDDMPTMLEQLPARTASRTPNKSIAAEAAPAKSVIAALPMALPRYALLVTLMLCWTALTAFTSYAWANPLRLAEDLASRAPQSPRAQYELGRTYIIYSHYDPASPFTRLAYAPLEKSAALPNSSILPEQALIFMNSRMHLPIKDDWWDSMISKLHSRRSTVQDESSLGALTQCDREHRCDLPKERMMQAYLAALSHPDPSARLLAMYGDYAWNVLEDHGLGESMIADAVKTAPNEPAYRITLVRMLAAQGRKAEARTALEGLLALDIGGRLDTSLQELRALPGMQ